MKTRIEMTFVGEKKNAVAYIAGILDTEVKYMGMPSAAYEAKGWSIDRNMLLKSPVLEEADYITLRQICDTLLAEGYTASGQMTVEVMPDEMDISKLEMIEAKLGSKASLIKKAFGIETDLTILPTQDGFSFGFYNASLAYTDIISAIQFSVSVYNRSASQKRVTCKDKPSENEKYAFRNFLNSMGCMGAPYKIMRKTLCKRLSGNSAFKSGTPGKRDDAPAEDQPPADPE